MKKLPEHIANRLPLPEAPPLNPHDLSTPSAFYSVLTSLVQERDLCQTAVSTRNEPTTGQPLKRGEHPRYITRLEDAQARLTSRLELYAKRFGPEAAAEMSEFIGAVQR